MYSFLSPSGFAFIDTIEDRRYTICEYANRESWRTCQPPAATHRLVGTPNITDCLAALPDGYVYEGGGLPLHNTVPPSVTARQIRLWLVTNGFSLSQVDAAISAIPDEQQREVARIEWEYAPYIERSHPMLLPLAASLGMDESQVDAAFMRAEAM